MIPAFVEGVRSSVLPCSLTLIVLVAAVALTSRRPVLAVMIAAGGAVAAMWTRAAGLAPVGRWVAVVLAVLTLGGVAVWWRLLARPTRTELLLAVVPGVFAGWLWQPCVGEILGEILEGASAHTVASVVLLAGYSLGTLVPAILIALARVALGDPPRFRRPQVVVGGVAMIAVAVLVILGLEGRVLSWLLALST